MGISLWGRDRGGGRAPLPVSPSHLTVLVLLPFSQSHSPNGDIPTVHCTELVPHFGCLVCRTAKTSGLLTLWFLRTTNCHTSKAVALLELLPSHPSQLAPLVLMLRSYQDVTTHTRRRSSSDLPLPRTHPEPEIIPPIRQSLLRANPSIFLQSETTTYP